MSNLSKTRYTSAIVFGLTATAALAIGLQFATARPRGEPNTPERGAYCLSKFHTCIGDGTKGCDTANPDDPGAAIYCYEGVRKACSASFGEGSTCGTEPRVSTDVKPSGPARAVERVPEPPTKPAGGGVAACKQQAAHDYAAKIKSCERSFKWLAAPLRQCKSEAKTRHDRALAACDAQARKAGENPLPPLLPLPPPPPPKDRKVQ